ncbi:MAG TPA: hypothetical protein VJZ71_11650 [Phycisphaerae bacterium]|nr:hypothetical protein [Phycisphaerae bacterium]
MAVFKFNFGFGAKKIELEQQGRFVGSFTPPQLAEMMSRGELKDGDRVRPEGTDEWVPYSQLKAAEKVINFDSRESPYLPDLSDLFSWRGPIAWLGGGGLMGLLILGFYVFAMVDWNRSIEQQKNVRDLAAKIARYVDGHPGTTSSSADDLRRAGAIIDDDVKLLQSNNIELRPINASSPRDAVVLVWPKTDTTRYYLKGGDEDYSIRWKAPQGSRVLVNEPQTPGSKTRILSIVDASRGSPLWTTKLQGYAMSAMWRKDGRMVAVNNTGPIDQKRVLVLRASDPVTPFGRPDQLDPWQCLEEADRKTPLRWSSNDVRGEKWLENGDLEVESFGNIVYLDENKHPTGYLMVRVRWVLHPGDDGRLAVVSSQRMAYQKTEAKQ